MPMLCYLFSYSGKTSSIPRQSSCDVLSSLLMSLFPREVPRTEYSSPETRCLGP